MNYLRIFILLIFFKNNILFLNCNSLKINITNEKDN